MKTITFLYGIIAYILFLATFLYAIGFMGNMIVPKDLNTGTEAGLGYTILINVLLLGVFAIQHTIMARPKFKEWWTKLIGTAAERSTFVLFTCAALALLFWQWIPIKNVIWNVEGEMLRQVITGIFFLGVLVVLLSTFMINHFDLFGLKQVYENVTGKSAKEQIFTTNYLYAFVRHPIMLGFLIMLWAIPTMTAGHLLFSVVTSLYIFIGVKYFEEKDLRNALGEKYEEYQKKVPMLIPFFGWK